MKIKPFIPSIAWLTIIVFMSSYPGKNLPQAPFNGFDKLVHLIIYAALTFLIAIGFFKQSIAVSKNTVFIIVFSSVISTFIGGAMELLQEYVFLNRYGDWADFFANSVGSVMGIIVFYFVVRKRN